MLAKKSTPEAVRAEVIERAESGEPITFKDVRPRPRASRRKRTHNDWRDRRWFREALKVANDAIRIGQRAQSISRELRLQMREALEPLRGQLAEVKKGGQALLDYFGLIENILTEGEPLVLAEAAE